MKNNIYIQFITLIVLFLLVNGCAQQKTISSQLQSKDNIPDNVNNWEDLGGYISGVIIERRGANYDVQVRGVNSISSMGQTGGQNSNRPLYIINGVPCQNSLDRCGIHPSQVKEIKVLKGEETSFYGSKGGNGVVIITTKNK